MWSLHVTRNWRITFRIDPVEREIFDLDYEDFTGKEWTYAHAPHADIV
jgi:hypothetical protein